MKMWKYSFILCLALLIVSNVFWAYLVIDQGISYSYLSDSFEEVSGSNQKLGQLIVDGAERQKYTQKDILFLLRQADPKAFIVEGNGTIITSFAKFNFIDGKLAYVE